jgi:outer membrane protein W
MADAETTQLLGHEQSPTTGNNGSVTVDQSSPGITSPLQQDEPHWRLRFNLSFVDPMGDSVSSSIGHGTIKFGMGAGVGAGLQAEYRATPRLGVEIGIMGASEFNISNNISRGSIRGDISLTGFAPLSLGLNFHLTPERKFDFYAGPQIALVNYGTDRIWWGMSSSGTRVSLDNDWAWGLVAGLDLPMGKRGWLFNANLRYLETSIKQSQGDFHFDREFDPLVLSVGVGYAF